MIKISYTVWRKNKDRGDLTYWCRVRERGAKPLDVNLHTTDKAQAEAFVMLREREVELYNAQLLVGENPDSSKLLRRSTHLIAQKGTSGTVLTLTKLLDEWEENLRLRGLSERTIRMYRKSVEYIVKDTSIPLDSLNRATVRTLLAAQNHIKSTTRRSYFVAFSECLKYLSKMHGLDRSLVDEIPMIKQTHTDRPYWSINQIRHIIDAVKCKTEDMARCYKAYYWFLATTGCRQGEGGLVEWSDIKDNCVTFRAAITKTRTPRTVPLDWRILDMLNQLPRKSKLVFADINQSQAGRFAVLAKAIRRSGMPLGGLHTFRHSASYILYKSSNDIKATSQMLGHSPQTALFWYQATRSTEELTKLVETAFDGNVLPDAMDRLVEEGLI